MTKIKICGLKRLCDIEYVNEAMPDYAGFVFFDKSKRNVTFEEASALRALLDKSIESVGVFVDRDIDDIVYLTERRIISTVQLHGNESESDIREIKRRCPDGVMVIKAFEVNDTTDFSEIEHSCADMVLIDAGKGSGATFNWDLLRNLKRSYFLAGGLGIENVALAIEKLKPYAVDISSKVETDGLKDRDKIKEFCAAVRMADGR